jgi:hypothetical protein
MSDVPQSRLPLSIRTLLEVVIAAVAVVLLIGYFRGDIGGSGRYEVHSNIQWISGETTFGVFDTKTGRLWRHSPPGPGEQWIETSPPIVR